MRPTAMSGRSRCVIVPLLILIDGGAGDGGTMDTHCPENHAEARKGGGGGQTPTKADRKTIYFRRKISFKNPISIKKNTKRD